MEQLVSIREMNQRLSRYLEAVERGEVVIITRRGRPIARLLPIEAKRSLTDEQKAARARALERMRVGFSLGGERFDRAAIYDE